MATVLVPTPLRRLTGGASKVTVDGDDVGSLIQAVDVAYPGVAERLLDGDGNVKRFINVFVNDDEIRHLQVGDMAHTSSSVRSLSQDVRWIAPPSF